MKLLLYIVVIVLILLAIGDMLIWLAAAASSHKLEPGTHTLFATILLVILGLLALLVWLPGTRKHL